MRCLLPWRLKRFNINLAVPDRGGPARRDFMAQAAVPQQPHDPEMPATAVTSAPMTALEHALPGPGDMTTSSVELNGKVIMAYKGPSRSPEDWDAMRVLAEKVRPHPAPLSASILLPLKRRTGSCA